MEIISNMKAKETKIKMYVDMTKPYLRALINDHKTRREWKTQLTLQIDFGSSKYSEETRTMYTKCHSTEIIMSNETDEIIEKLCESLYKIIKKI